MTDYWVSKLFYDLQQPGRRRNIAPTAARCWRATA